MGSGFSRIRLRRREWVLVAALMSACTLAASAPRLWFPDHPLTQRFMGRLADGTISRGDDPAYDDLARYFRGELPRQALVTPFAYRVGLPAAVAALPFPDVDLTGRYVNTIALVLANLGIVFLGLAMGATRGEAIWAGALGAFSFGTFWNGPCTTPDATVLLILVACLACLQTGRRGWFWAVASAGVLVKEWVLVVVPVALTLDLVARRSWRRRLATVALGAIPVGVMLLTRFAFRDLHAYVWWPDVARVLSNLSRPRAYLSVGLTLGATLILVPVAFVFRRWWWDRWRAAGALPLLAAAAFWFSALPVYGLLAAYLDGRFVWMLYPVAMPLSGAGVCAAWARFKSG